MKDLGQSKHLLSKGGGRGDQNLGLKGKDSDGLGIVREEGEEGR